MQVNKTSNAQRTHVRMPVLWPAFSNERLCIGISFPLYRIVTRSQFQSIFASFASATRWFATRRRTLFINVY